MASNKQFKGFVVNLQCTRPSCVKTSVESVPKLLEEEPEAQS